MNVRELDSVWTGQSARCHRLHLVASGFQRHAARRSSCSTWRSADGRKHCRISRFQMALQVGLFGVFARREAERSRNSGTARRLRTHCISRTRSASELLDCGRASTSRWRLRYPSGACDGGRAKRQVGEYCSTWLDEDLGSIPQLVELPIGPCSPRRPAAPKERPTRPARGLCFGGGAACGSSGRCAHCTRAAREMAGGWRTRWRADRPHVGLGCIEEGGLHHARGLGLHQPATTARRQATAAARSAAR